MFEAHTLSEKTEPHLFDLHPFKPSTPSFNPTSNINTLKIQSHWIKHPIYQCNVWVWNAFGKRETLDKKSTLQEFIFLEYKNTAGKCSYISLEKNALNNNAHSLTETLLSQDIEDISPQKTENWACSLQNDRN